MGTTTGTRVLCTQYLLRVASDAVGADVYNRPLEVTVGAFFLYLVGDGREDLCDSAGAARGNDVLSAASGTFQLLMGGGHVDFDPLVELEHGGIAL